MNATTSNASEIEAIVVQECKLKGYSQKTIDNYSDISTTLVYTRVSNKDIRNIRSPMDD